MGEWTPSNVWKDGRVDFSDQILRNKQAVHGSEQFIAFLDDAAMHKLAHFEQRRPFEGAVLSCADNAFRWKKGERLDHLFERRCDRFENLLAVVTETDQLTYQELDRRANQVARYLADEGVRSGDRVGLLFDKSIETYVALLAVLKINAAYVPFDPAFPEARIQSIVADAGVNAIVSMSAFDEKLRAFDGRCFYLDAAKRQIDAKPQTRLTGCEVLPPVDQICYIIYTSGTTGTPKGVVIEHPSICNFVQVAAELYGFIPGDRVYQGMTIAFDFSVEEIWVPLMAGATLIPGKQGASLVADELADFLRDQEVTCICCCPTLLATIEQELPRLRILLVGGEACPQNLVARWYRPGRTILNSYGPTEATVTATLTELTPSKPVTIGKPLPTYSIVILDPDADKVVAPGELGEIGIAGIGVAAGYLNRDDLSRKKFIPDFLQIPNNLSQRIYRTGDLGRINDHGEVECHGRIDSQVKIRGYRIELVEIESVLMEIPQIAQAAVSTCEADPGFVEIVAYYSLKQGAPDLPRTEIAQALSRRLPPYMVPAFLEHLPFIPMLISNKADHKKLPRPKGPRLTAETELVVARTETELLLADALADVLKIERISVEDHFFNDLGGHSLLMARFCAKIRQNPGMSHVSMRDIYLNPTIAKLANHLGDAANEEFVATEQEPFHVASDFAYYGCGTLQLLSYAGYTLLLCWIVAFGFSWVTAAKSDPVELYMRGMAFTAVMFAGLTALAIAAKWLLIGKWKAEAIPIWSLRYFRFWLVKFLVQTAPMAAFVGNPLYNIYLRLLGAKIGRNTVIECRYVPISTDLFTVGDNTILRKDSILLGYRAQSNFIHTGWINIGSNAFVGEASVLDIDTAMGDDTQLGHASSLQSGQRVPDGKRYHGSPALETSSDYCPIESKNCSTLRRGLYASLPLIGLLIVAPAAIMMLDYWYAYFIQLTAVSRVDFEASALALVSLLLLTSAGVFFGSLVVGLFGIYLIPRLCHRLLETEKTYVLYGLHYFLQRLVSASSNSRFYNLLFGDSSVIVHYMRFIGWNLNDVEQTGSNFGTNQRHDNPFLCEIGSRTMVSDGLSMMNMHVSNSSFRLAKTRIGERNYLGNDIHYPPDGRTGANCLLATKVMIPIDAAVRENVGLLGSPCFEIPRMVERDKEVNRPLSEETRRQRIGRKNAHNAITAALFLFTRWIFFFATLLVGHLAAMNYERLGVFSLLLTVATLSLAAVLYFALIERASLWFKRLTPKMVSIYDLYFWHHERHWKLSDSPIMERFGGTPLKNLISRLVGVKIGRKVYDGGCSITDRTLTEIDDCANLNEGSVLQAHSLEEGVFKSDHIRIGQGSTLGPGAFVHYGVSMGQHVVLDADSFLMKGEILEEHTRWRGNPARLLQGSSNSDHAVGSDAATNLSPSSAREAFIPKIAAE